MVTRIFVAVVLINAMVQAAPQLSAREPRWGKPGEYADGEWEKKYESPDFTVEKVEENYEKRVYPPSTWACTNMTVDTAQDPLAGLENWDFTEIMQSKRYKTKVPSSLMFWPLFRYIGGNNKGKVYSMQGVITFGIKWENTGQFKIKQNGDISCELNNLNMLLYNETSKNIVLGV